MTAMERLMAEQNAVPPMLRDVPLDDTQAQPEMLMPPSAQAQMAGLASDLSSSGDFREPSTMTAMERLMAEQNAVPPMLRDVSLDDTQAQPEAEPPVSRKQTVLERRGLESMFGGPDLSNYTGERTTFSDAMTNPADPTFETLDDNKAAIDELLKNKDLSDNERKALESKRAALEGLSLTNTFVKGFVKDTIGLDENTKTALNDTLNRTNDALTDVAALGVRATAPYVSVVSPTLGAKLFNAGDYLAAFGQDPNASDFNFGSEDLLMGQDVIKPTTPVVDPKVDPKVTLGNDITPEKLTTATDKILTALSNGDDDAAAEGMLADFGVADAGSLSMEEQTNKMVEVFKKILGEDDSAKAKRNALLMANIGFSIAAQGGPNALQNIATGFQQGSAQAMENMATDQARQDKIKMLGIETAADQMAANQKYKRDMAIANIKDSVDRSEYLFKDQVTANISSFMVPFTEQGKSPTPAELLKINEEAMRIAATTNPEAASAKAYIARKKKEIAEKKGLSEAAKERGETTFTYNGSTFNVLK
tara:strand:- start:1239 stop:2843 length:1605 start_codon:yes stop_codon:yes gene_type:complete